MTRTIHNAMSAVALASILVTITGCAAGEPAALRPDAVPVEMIDGNALPSAATLSGHFPTAPGIDEFVPDAEEPTPQDETHTVNRCRGYRVTDVLFASGSHELEAAGVEAIAEIARGIPEGATIEIEGHTDNLPIAIGNQRLSELRAESVAVALESHLGPNRRIVAIGGAADREPIDDNATKTGRERNRRVEILVNCGGSQS